MYMLGLREYAPHACSFCGNQKKGSELELPLVLRQDVGARD